MRRQPQGGDEHKRPDESTGSDGSRHDLGDPQPSSHLSPEAGGEARARTRLLALQAEKLEAETEAIRVETYDRQFAIFRKAVFFVFAVAFASAALYFLLAGERDLAAFGAGLAAGSGALGHG